MQAGYSGRGYTINGVHRRGRRSGVHVKATAGVTTADTTTSRFETLQAAQVVSCVGETTNLTPFLPEKGRSVAVMLTNFADFDSWELAKGLVDVLPSMAESGVSVVAVGIGSAESAKLFAQLTNFPEEKLFCDPTGALHTSLGFQPGVGRKGGLFGDIDSVASLSGFAKLMIMCAGIGSPGTLKEVFRGYLGDRSRPPIFREGTNTDIPWRGLFDIVGKGYQRPFELATLRLQNMTAILKNWEELGPNESDLLLQRGGAIIFQDGEVVYEHQDAGILGFVPAEKLAELSKAADPLKPRPLEDVLHDCALRRAWSEDVYFGIKECEKTRRKENRVAKVEDIHGQWRLQWTGPKRVFPRGLSDGSYGSYFPLCARQSFNTQKGTIRNGVYVGADGKICSLYFDGVFDWQDKGKILEFVFKRVSFTIGTLPAFKYDLDETQWNKTKAAEQKIVYGKKEESVRTTPGRAGSNPFFKFVFADDKCIAARGKGGGLALWGRYSEEAFDE